METRRKNQSAKNMALGGTLAALAVVIMGLGGLIPIATFCCPVLAALLLIPVLETCGRRIAWAWYGAVALLSALLCQDKEAAGLFVFLGYYPILKPRLDKLPKVLSCALKFLLFNLAAAVLYALLIWLLGIPGLKEEFQEMGLTLFLLTLALGNLTFFLSDFLIGRLTLLLQRKNPQNKK